MKTTSFPGALRCLWTGCVSCPACDCPRSCNLHPWGETQLSRAHSAKSSPLGRRKNGIIGPAREDFFVSLSVRWLSRKTGDAQFPLSFHPTNNKLAKHEPESSSERTKEGKNDIPRSRRATFFIGNGGGREYCRTKNGSSMASRAAVSVALRFFLCFEDCWLNSTPPIARY